MKMRTVTAIARKELSDYFNSPVAYIILVVLWLISGWFFTSSIFLIGQATLTGFSSNLDLFLVFIIPAISMRLISDERRYGTIENILTAPISSQEVIVGKYLGALALGLFALAGTLIYPITLSFLGRLDWGYVFGVYAGYAFLTAMYMAAGLFASSLTRQNVSAYLISFVICFVFFMLGKVTNFVPDFLTGIFSFLSADSHLANISKGVIDLRDVLYFITVSAVFLALADRVVSAFKNKWDSFYLKAVAVLIVLNYFASIYFVRIDLTSTGEYSLSKASKRVVRNLKEPIFVKAYFNSNLPAQYKSVTKYTTDLLQEYRSYNHSKIKYDLKDPSSAKDIQKEARESGLYPIQFTKIAADKYEVASGFMGIVMYYEDRKQIIPFVKDTSDLEYMITSAFKKLVDPVKKRVAVIKSFGAKDLTDNQDLSSLLAKEYDVINITTSTAESDYSALLLISPHKRLSPVDLSWLKDKIAHVPTALFIDRLDVPMDTFYGAPVKCNFNDILSPYGIKALNGTVLDMQNQRIGVQQQRGWMTISNIVNYPPFITATNFGKSPVTSRMEKVTLPFCAAFEVAASSHIKTQSFVFSSKRSWLDTITVFNPLQNFMEPRGTKKGPFALGVTAMLPSSRLLVLGTSRFTDKNSAQDPSNATFFMNIVDWLAQDTDLIDIRSKVVTYRPLKKISNGGRILFKYFNLLGNSIILLLIGLIVWRRNNAKREFFRRLYEQ